MGDTFLEVPRALVHRHNRHTVHALAVSQPTGWKQSISECVIYRRGPLLRWLYNRLSRKALGLEREKLLRQLSPGL